MTKPHLITAGLAGCLLLVSCEPLPVGPEPRSGPYGRDQRQSYPGGRYQQPENRYGQPDGRYGTGMELPPEPQPAPQPTRDQYPSAERTDNPNQVISPYAPYNVIDVEGFRSGQLAKDPSNGKIFRIP
ncbi:hypothetical protein HZ994_03015 [Akkermansiaceae bacterium]|nr:hypothetical protein HZ994_03015 [Akkermansiaceae bacterium]